MFREMTKSFNTEDTQDTKDTKVTEELVHLSFRLHVLGVLRVNAFEVLRLTDKKI